MSFDPIKMPKRFDYSASMDFNIKLTHCLGKSTDVNRKVILDCLHMEFIDSAGMGILIMAHKKAQNEHAQLVMTNVNPAAKEILYLANIQKLIEMN